MAKFDTIQRYRDEFLQGRSQEYIDKFNQKSEERQYSSIMAWRHKTRCKERESASADEIVENLRLSRSKLSALRTITEDDINNVEREITMLADHCKELRHKLRDDEIRRLESEQSRIAQRLQQLRGAEPSLFD